MRFFFVSFIVAGFLLVGRLALGQVEPPPIPNAHAHNDYEHDRPLLDALENGFCSVEADVFLVEGQLLVAHNFRDVRAQRTLENLYLKPLKQRVRQFDGSVYATQAPFTLLVDIKGDATKTYEALTKLLAQYAEILTEYRGNGQVLPRAVTVVISGNRDWKTISADSPRWAGIDGRLSDLDKDIPASVMPLVSDRWTSHFQWRGEGEMPPAERKKLQGIVQRAHTNGQRVRFWATPENESLWQELLEAGVDLINTDQLPRLRRFLTQHTARDS